MTFTIPGGRERGVPIEEASPKTRAWWRDKFRNNLAQGTSRDPAHERAWVEAVDALEASAPQQQELAQHIQNQGPRETRTAQYHPATPDAAGPRDNAALARVDETRLAAVQGSFHTANAVNAMFASAREIGHLISPQSTCGELPLGCSVGVSVVRVDPNRHAYSVGANKFMLDRTALRRLASAMSMDWIESVRTDDQSDPHYCAWRATALVRDLDGSTRRVPGSAAIDVREGSQLYNETEERARERNKANAELGMFRKFIERHAESKAMNRAIRDATASGNEMYFTREELLRPFIVVRLMRTGRCPENPELEKALALRIFDSFDASRAQLFPAAAQPAAAVAPHAPPPIAAASSVARHPDDDFPDDWYGDGPDDSDGPDDVYNDSAAASSLKT